MLGRRRHGARAFRHRYPSCGRWLSGYPSKSIALVSLRMFLSRQSDGKMEFLDPTTSSGKFAKKGTRSSNAARR
eukprot:4822566-Prymnesium_polylepis.1